MDEARTITKSSKGMPESFGDKLKMADVLCKSGLMPKGLDTPQKLVVALQYGHELGLSPMVAAQNMAVVNGRPSLSADLMLGIVKQRGLIDDIRVESTPDKCVVIGKRRGMKSEHTVSFSMEDARRAGLLAKDNWKNYPQRMCRARAIAWWVRDVFSDILAGLHSTEELESVGSDVQSDSSIGDAVRAHVEQLSKGDDSPEDEGEKVGDIDEQHPPDSEDPQAELPLDDEQKSCRENQEALSDFACRKCWRFKEAEVTKNLKSRSLCVKSNVSGGSW